MTLKEFSEQTPFERICAGGTPETQISHVYCCDLLSIAMSKAPQGSAWVTVMGNTNAVAVCVLAEIGCLILAEGVTPDAHVLESAERQGVAVFKTDMPVFQAALAAHNLIHGQAVL